MSDNLEFDALVIGAGAGGLFTAALLAKRGYRTLLVERLGEVGGRASTRYKDGFAVNTGALGIEIGTETEEVFNEVGARLIVRQPSPGIVCRVSGKDINISAGLPGMANRVAIKLLRLALHVIPPLQPRTGESSHAWVTRFTNNPTVLGLLHNFIGSIFATTPHLLPADLFLHYLTTKGAFKQFGFPPGGTVTVWQELLTSYKRHGGEIWLNAQVQQLSFAADGTVNGATVNRDGIPRQLTTKLTVSDIGPQATLGLCGDANLPADYITTVKRQYQPSAIITIYFASTTPLASFPGFACFSSTRRLCYAANFTQTCPENSPPNWHVYCGASVPQPCTGDFNETNEIELLKADLLDEFPGFAQARILDVVVTRDEWPAQRAMAGADLPNETPIANLWNVGDGVKEWGSAATTACAETAILVAAKIERAYPWQVAQAALEPQQQEHAKAVSQPIPQSHAVDHTSSSPKEAL
ncbi:NAD(P)/FAD-dependent oxidoreductase [Pseudomonas sp. NFACC08-1]|uniref:phytoene desaturase family protein n=1 Tax=Pseudomonas sp. NFACC08-1 TaxID=1566238 RepID=UPI00089C9384|nr:NAD(P)-binding protein [Pseudomonas sp. NFACC08-1]SDY54733.1 Phytoene dehydrogenase-related protein [Pseudomonas sp. NFACC08-1]